MRLLILGGTRFVGRHFVSAALKRRHHVTLFNRGNHPNSFSGVEEIRGDRNSDLDRLGGRRWDAVIDTSGYLPRAVKASAEFLSESVKQYVFISSISAYDDFSDDGVDESAPLKSLTSEQLETANAMRAKNGSAIDYGAMYGGLKALSEAVVEQVFPKRALIIRPGVIVGPGDYTDRFTYWVARVAEGGEVLAPAPPDKALQFIDVRDLAEWTIAMIEDQISGIYNAISPPGAVTMKSLLETAKQVSESNASFTWVSEEFLLRENVLAWSELPLWMPVDAAPHMRGFMLLNTQKASNSGLKSRELTETIEDTLAWLQSAGKQRPLAAGLAPAREEELLAKWHQTLTV